MVNSLIGARCMKGLGKAARKTFNKAYVVVFSKEYIESGQMAKWDVCGDGYISKVTPAKTRGVKNV